MKTLTADDLTKTQARHLGYIWEAVEAGTVELVSAETCDYFNSYLFSGRNGRCIGVNVGPRGGVRFNRFSYGNDLKVKGYAAKRHLSNFLRRGF